MASTLRNWLQLSLTNGIGPVLARRLIEKAGSAAAACEASVAMLRTVEGIGVAGANKIADALKSAAGEVDREIDKAAGAGVSIICPDDDSYPILLKEIPDPPMVLYVRGVMEDRDLHAVAIVGSRKCSNYGREQAERFGALLAGAGVTVISGGARGIDSAAHRGAMQPLNGRTIAVLGCGVDVAYPPENAQLFLDIPRDGRGAVVSEYALGTDPRAENFPRRNRLISGLSRGVLVVEADIRSGALITARQAVDDHGRTVFALPGRVDNPMSAGPHQLIRDGATLVTNLEEILEGLGPLPIGATEPTLFSQPKREDQVTEDVVTKVTTPSPKTELSNARQRILGAVDGQELDADGIIDSTGLPAQIVMQELTLMTLKGLIKKVDATRFAKR